MGKFVNPEYARFLEGKKIQATMRGMENVPALESHLFPFQKRSVEFALKAGSSALLLSTGLGKTVCELSFGMHAAEASNGRALILTPLAVARQIEAEGKRFGYPIQVIREQEDSREGLNVCNYDRLKKLNPETFGVIVMDESSCIKAYEGKTTRTLIDTFAHHQWKLAATATIAPNDTQEIGSHSEMLSVMAMNEMLVRWFTHDSGDTGTWRLKGHGRESFWDWMASWAVMADHPRDLGDPIEGFDLPGLNIIRHAADSSDVKSDGMLFAALDASATGIHKIKRQTVDARARMAGEIVCPSEPWLIWVDTDYEQSACEKILGDKCFSVRGSLSIDEKERRIGAWINGDRPFMLSKSEIMGFGLNLQFCWNQVFVGRLFSYEQWFQAIRRSWRFGQTRDVNIHLVVAEGEDSIGRVIDRKSDDHIEMKREMSAAMRRSLGIASQVKIPYDPNYIARLPRWISAV